MLERVERGMRALSCGDSVAGMHRLIGVAPRLLSPYALSDHRALDPGPCEALLRLLDRAGRPSPRALALRGRLLRVLRRNEEALAVFDRALALPAPRGRAPAWRAELLLSSEGRTARSLEALTAAASADPSDPWPTVWAAASLLAEGASPEVFTALDAALGASPRHVPALLLRAAAFERRGELDAALADASAAARADRSCPGAHVLRGRLQAKLGLAAEAENSFAAATRLEPTAKDFYALIAAPNAPDAERAGALTVLDRWLRRRPASAWARALCGDKLRAARPRSRRGVAELERAVKLDPATPWMRACLARAQVQILRSRRGLTGLRAAAGRDPRCGWLRAWQAEALRQFGRRREARETFKRAIALSPRFAQARLWLGRLHGDEGRWDLALREYDAALRLDCDDGYAYAKRGQALARLGRREQAVKDFDRALALRTHAPDWVRGLRAECLKEAA